jgi:hypothetical protein
MVHERARDQHLTRTLAGPTRLFAPVCLMMLSLLLVPGIARAQAGADSLLLHWTAPGDDGTIGLAAQYELRYDTAPISEATFANATFVSNTPAPAAPTTYQAVRVRGLSRGTPYWFAVRTRDAAGNWSPLSNVFRWDWPVDAAPPSTPLGLQGSVQTAGKVILIGWRANPEADLMGYNVYRAVHGTNAWQRLNGPLVPQPSFEDDALPSDANGIVDYAVTAVDQSANESGRSALLAVQFGPVKHVAASAWGLEAPYPNPSRLSEVARLPVSLPASPGAARVEIHDGNDAIVRRIVVAGAANGRFDIAWDGRNDAGQLCAPGVYRAWLMANGVQRMVRVARVP